MISTLRSKKLTLRPYQMSDAKNIQRLAGDKAIADMTGNILHPYLDGMPEEWMSKHEAWFYSGTGIALGKVRIRHLFSVLSEKVPSKASFCSNVGTFQKATTKSGPFSERPVGRGLKALSIS